MTDTEYVQSIADGYATNPAPEIVKHRARLLSISRRLAVAQRLADALKACWDLGIDSHLVPEVSAALKEWEQTR